MDTRAISARLQCTQCAAGSTAKASINVRIAKPRVHNDVHSSRAAFNPSIPPSLRSCFDNIYSTAAAVTKLLMHSHELTVYLVEKPPKLSSSAAKSSIAGKASSPSSSAECCSAVKCVAEKSDPMVRCAGNPRQRRDCDNLLHVVCTPVQSSPRCKNCRSGHFGILRPRPPYPPCDPPFPLCSHWIP